MEIGLTRCGSLARIFWKIKAETSLTASLFYDWFSPTFGCTTIQQNDIMFMEATLHVANTSVSLSQLAQLIRDQFPAEEREHLASLIQEDAAPTKEQLLNQLKEDYIALQKGTLKTRPLKDVLDEL